MEKLTDKMPVRRSELLMPAGSLERLKIAILYGADAVYLGTPDMSLRTKSAFTLEEVVEGVKFAHAHGKRVYLTLNLFIHNKDIGKLPEYLDTVRTVKPDGLIVADPGVFNFVKEHAPELEIHISTQANVCSWLSVDFWRRQGASLCVLAREVSYEEMREIREKCPDIKLEAFVHGAMCMTYSGRCLLSNFMAERGANQGNCANSCRWKYKLHMRLKDGTRKEIPLSEENLELFDFFLEEGYRPGDFLPFEEDERGAYILNSKDLCLMPRLDDFLRIGIDSLKVEGRNKSPYYVAVVAKAYRKAIDDWYADDENWDSRPYMRMLETIPNRGYTLAFHDGRLTNYAHNYDETRTLSEWEFAAIVTAVNDDSFVIQPKNKIVPGNVLEFISPFDHPELLLRIYEFEDATNGKIYEQVHAGDQKQIRIPFALFEHENIDAVKKNFPVMSVIRKEKPLSAEEWHRLRLDSAAHNIEMKRGRETVYQERKDKLQEAIDEGARDRRIKTPRFGVEGCCGKGCNGCLVFWHDSSYEKAREILKQKKQGEMLSSR